MPFGIEDIAAIMPEIIIILAGTALLMVDLFVKKHNKEIIAALSMGFILAAGWYSYQYAGVDMVVMAGMFKLDALSTFFKFIFYIATFLSILLSLYYVKKENVEMGEYYILMLFVLAGMMFVASAADLLMIYIGLELMALPLYVLVGFKQKDIKSNEGAMKYIILGAFSSGVLLYGMSLIYGLTGTTEIIGISEALSQGGTDSATFALALILVAGGFAFKIAAVPFHMWAPDVYEGAPTPITAFMSVGPKAAGFAALIRVFALALPAAMDQWQFVLMIIAVLTMVYGNIVAIQQTNIKRMLAYSSIGHAGFALLGLIAGTQAGVAAILFYLLVYTFMNLGAFAIIIMMNKGDKNGENISDYTGLAKNNKLLAFVMLIFFFSLAGIPPTGGFIAKFYIFMALINKGMIGLAVVAVLMSAVAAYYYIRIIMLMYMKEPEGEIELVSSKEGGYKALLCVITIAVFVVLWLGINPEFVIDLAHSATIIK